MRRIALGTIVGALALVAAIAPGAAAAYTNLAPGNNPANLDETVDVNVVFVGYEAADVPWSGVAAELPASGDPVIRQRKFYSDLGLAAPDPLGISYTYGYNPVYASSAWEDAFFGHLSSLAAPQSTFNEPGGPFTRTAFQQDYNNQAANALDVGTNHFISGPAVERYLMDHLDDAGVAVDATKPTVVFVNWFGRDDFKFHTYVKLNEPDPDTNYNFGLNRQTRKVIAWGGTAPDDEEDGYSGPARRIWFHDLSAGPEAWTDNWNVDNADVDGDGTPDYRLPPVWEYGSDDDYAHPGYPGEATLASDLGKVARYVGLDLLFTTSPLYPPYHNDLDVRTSVDLDVQVVEGWNKVDSNAQFRTPSLLLDEVSELNGYSYTTSSSTLAFKDDIKNCYLQWVVDVRCYNNHVQYPAFANIFLNAAAHVGEYVDGGGDYDAVLVSYSVGQAPKQAGLLGFADDNYLDGTQSGVFSFVYPQAVAAGYGLTTTEIHEFGHHSSMSHPHDGYDPGTDEDFGPGGATYFAWSGDQSNSMMSYIDLNWDFSQFDRDNSARHHAAGLWKTANRLAQRVIDAGPGAGALAQLTLADTDLGLASLAMASHDYELAFAKARDAYLKVRSAATLTPGTNLDGPYLDRFFVLPEAKGGVGLGRRAAYAVDLDERANVKRMFGK